MAATKEQRDVSGLIGRRVEELSLSERLRYANTWVAFRIYTPTTELVQRDGQPAIDLRSRRIEAAGASPQELIAQLRRRNLDPAEYEFTILKQPY
ncbi:MAG TPA: hypothetical protein VNN17_02985 [Terriglobia bacterium]|nr:hypothetical protein [Terriglobia bacterium]